MHLENRKRLSQYMNNNIAEIDLLFETSWEVCNKIGGIYTVLSTKAHNLQSLYKDKIIFVGPDVWTDETPCPVFKEVKSLLRPWRESCMLPEGVSVRVGRWEVPGRPIAVLVKFDGMYKCKDEFYGHMWERFHVDSLHGYGDYDEACAFSHAAGIVIQDIINFYKTPQNRVIAHFDEWTTGMGLLYIKDAMPGVATIFTTHATSIGRSICGNGKPLYDQLHNYNGDQMARELNMESKHSLEKAAAHQADCFTTVSEITARECEQLLERRPDVVTPNGFEKNFVPAGRKFDTARRKARDKMLDVAKTLTGIEFTDDTFIITTSGRCEWRNKGLDLYIDSMKRLSDLNPERRILAWVMVPAWSDRPRFDLQQDIKAGKHTPLDDPFITHTLFNYSDDAIIQAIHHADFDNNSAVSIIYVPCYLNGNDGIFDMTYYDILIGMDATIFASYYEPWGYTPLESVAFGVPTITTSLSGFGQWVLSDRANVFLNSGVDVIPRSDHNYNQVKEAIADDILSLCSASDQQRASISAHATETADAAAWNYFIKYYVESFTIALTNAAKRV